VVAVVELVLGAGAGATAAANVQLPARRKVKIQAFAGMSSSAPAQVRRFLRLVMNLFSVQRVTDSPMRKRADESCVLAVM